jgi:hypothetical protein
MRRGRKVTRMDIILIGRVRLEFAEERETRYHGREGQVPILIASTNFQVLKPGFPRRSSGLFLLRSQYENNGLNFVLADGGSGFCFIYFYQ